MCWRRVYLETRFYPFVKNKCSFITVMTHLLIMYYLHYFTCMYYCASSELYCSSLEWRWWFFLTIFNAFSFYLYNVNSAPTTCFKVFVGCYDSSKVYLQKGFNVPKKCALWSAYITITVQKFLYHRLANRQHAYRILSCIKFPIVSQCFRCVFVWLKAICFIPGGLCCYDYLRYIVL